MQRVGVDSVLLSHRLRREPRRHHDRVGAACTLGLPARVQHEESARGAALVGDGARVKRLDQSDIRNPETVRDLPTVTVDTQHRVAAGERAARDLAVEARAGQRLR